MACLSTFDVGGCGCGEAGCGDCCVDCAPCPIPKADLTMSWTSTSIILPPGSSVMRYSPAAGNWTGLIPIPGSSQTTCILKCTASNVCFLFDAFEVQGLSCDYGGCSGSALLSVRLLSSACDPFQLVFDGGVGIGSCEDMTLLGMVITITGPSNSPYGFPVCCQTFAVTGCGGLALPGATVSVYDSEGGSLLTSKVTPASGIVTLWWSGSCDVWVAVTYPDGPGGLRFTAYGQSLSLTKAATTSVALSPTADYHCIPCCAVPVYKIYHVTNAVTGTRAVDWISGAQWAACYDEPVPSVNCDTGEATTGAPVTYNVAFLDNCKTAIEVTAPRCAFTGVSGTASGELGSSFDCAHSHGFGACAGSTTVDTDCTPPFAASGTISGATCTTFLGAGSTLAGSE